MERRSRALSRRKRDAKRGKESTEMDTGKNFRRGASARDLRPASSHGAGEAGWAGPAGWFGGLWAGARCGQAGRPVRAREVTGPWPSSGAGLARPWLGREIGRAHV